MDLRSIPVSSQKFLTFESHEIMRMMQCDAQPIMSYSPGLVQHITTYRVPARIAVGLGTVYYSNKGIFTPKMQAFWEHVLHAVAIYKVKVYTNKMIFMVE